MYILFTYNPYIKNNFNIDNKLSFERIIDCPVSVQRQRDDWVKLIDMDAVVALKYDKQMLSNIIRCIETLCTCPYGARTAGLCGHRSMFIQCLRAFILKKNIADPHPISLKHYSKSINIQNELQGIDYNDDEDENDDHFYI